MKKLLLGLFAAVVILSGCNKTQTFKVTLNLDNAENQPVYLTKTVDGQTVIIDSAVFVGKNAELTAPYDDPKTAYYIKFDLNRSCRMDGNCGESFAFFTENQNTTISGDRQAYPNWTVKGCPVMDEWAEYRKSLLPMEEQMLALFNEANDVAMAGDTVRGSEIFGQVYAMMDDYNNKRYEYFKSHGDSYLTHFLLDEEKEQIELEMVKEIANGFTNESIYSKNVKEYIEKSERAQGD